MCSVPGPRPPGYRIVHLSFGDFPGGEYTRQLFADHLIHAWELARAIGADEQSAA